MSAPSVGQGPRYLLVAAFCATLHNVMMIALDRVGVIYVASMLISMVVLLPIGFGLQAAFTFAAERTWSAFAKYTAVMASNLPMTFATIALFHDLMDLPMIIAAPLSTAALVLWNFVGAAWALRPARTEAPATGPVE